MDYYLWDFLEGEASSFLDSPVAREVGERVEKRVNMLVDVVLVPKFGTSVCYVALFRNSEQADNDKDSYQPNVFSSTGDSRCDRTGRALYIMVGVLWRYRPKEKPYHLLCYHYHRQ